MLHRRLHLVRGQCNVLGQVIQCQLVNIEGGRAEDGRRLEGLA